ncbi:hypothetical protein [Nocardioides sp. SYSU D00065]|uniref:hypothetical protein n=1 Tax=Nocardioides sp. SYSU D00065 TaxID=2817378 RepID=UPI001B330574|nr:hypothetical protein [Nocardioides sp. SYSU D00065]
MSAEQGTGRDEAAGFVVRPDGSVVGDDGADGALAAALPYTGRLARRMGELVDAGDLRLMEAFGTHRLLVGVTWTPAGEGTYRAAVTPVPAHTPPSVVVVGAVDTAAAITHCLERLSQVDGVTWSSVISAGSRVLAAHGERQELDHLAEVGNRMLAILRSLADQHATGFMRLRFEEGSLVGAALGRHALVARATSAADEDLLAMIDEIRAVLAGHDLTTVAREPAAQAGDQPEAQTAPVPPPALVGARFRGAGDPAGRKRRRPLFRTR